MAAVQLGPCQKVAIPPGDATAGLNTMGFIVTNAALDIIPTLTAKVCQLVNGPAGKRQRLQLTSPRQIDGFEEEVFLPLFFPGNIRAKDRRLFFHPLFTLFITGSVRN